MNFCGVYSFEKVTNNEMLSLRLAVPIILSSPGGGEIIFRSAIEIMRLSRRRTQYGYRRITSDDDLPNA